MTSVAEFHAMLKQPQAVILFVSGKHQILLDKDGSIARLMAEIESFRWKDIQAATNANISRWMMLMAENVHKVLREFQQENPSGLAFAISKLVAELTRLTALCHRTLITSDSSYYQQVQEAVGRDSAWTRYHRIATDLQVGPTGIVPLRARGIAILYLYRETLMFAQPVIQTEHREIAEHVLLVVQSAIEQLPFTKEERYWLKNWMN
jgi:hypothetical protein